MIKFKFDQIKKKEITQITIVIAYIIEIFLNQLADLIQEKQYDEKESLQKEFYKFLDTPKVKVFQLKKKSNL